MNIQQSTQPSNADMGALQTGLASPLDTASARDSTLEGQPLMPNAGSPAPQPLFTRFPAETSRAFSAFVAFFGLRHDRSLPALAAQLGEKPDTIKTWSSRFRCSQRIQSFNSGLCSRWIPRCPSPPENFIPGVPRCTAGPVRCWKLEARRSKFVFCDRPSAHFLARAQKPGSKSLKRSQKVSCG